MLSNMNQQPTTMDKLSSSILYFNSHPTKNDSKEFSIYRPDVDFSLNYEPINAQSDCTSTRLVNDAKEIVVMSTVPAAATATASSTAMTVEIQQKGSAEIVVVNGHNRAVMTSFSNHYPSIVHNYSKVPESMMTEMPNSDRNNNKNNNNNISNSSNSRESTATSDDGEEGNRDDNNNASNKPDDKKPEHHVRRPMNAFLIFCKRHRALVREKYPNLENRSITKILGDWWAFLPNEDKLPYKELAKNYKDVFFSKNPNFKWYKLPAPPLRTLSTRPGNDRDRAMTASPTQFNGDELPESPTSKDRVARNIKVSQQSTSGFGQFKLASIDQMGGLSSLMMVESSPIRVINGVIATEAIKDDLDTSLPPKKRKNEEIVELFDDEIAGKSRACKGKRYEQFMTPTKKATKQKSTNALSTPTSVHHPFPHNGYCKPQLESVSVIKNDDSCDEIIAHSPESDETNARNNMDASDFKLNDKIMTLPSLDLDDYLNRKKAMKKKKKFPHKAKHRQQQSQAHVPKDKAIPKPIVVVGSQKRKAPKQTIRRTADVVEEQQQPNEIARGGLIGLDTLATLALVQANASPQ